MTLEEFKQKYSKKTYIGDSVYFHFDGYHIILETINESMNNPSNVIALEPQVIDALWRCRKSIYEDYENLIKIAESELGKP